MNGDDMMPAEYYAAIERTLGRVMTATERKRAERTYGQDTNDVDVRLFVASVSRRNKV